MSYDPVREEWGQVNAYNKAIANFDATASLARNNLKAGANADSIVGTGLHQVQDAYAHTARDANGLITHIQCYNCGDSADHSHPDFRNSSGGLTTQAEGAIAASAAYITLMNGAASMSDEQFKKALENFKGKYLNASASVKNDTAKKP